MAAMLYQQIRGHHMNTVIAKLREYKLAGMATTIEERISYANNSSLSYQQFLELLFEDEDNNRRENNYNKRYKGAKLPAYKTIEGFDFNFQPSINQKQLNDFATCSYLQKKQNLIFIGNPGTGKSHLAIALAVKALARNYKVLFTSVAEMLYQLHISKADNSYYKKLNEYLSPDLLVLDELGFKKLPEYSADDFFEVIAKRYERASCIVTTNKSFEQWEDIFGDNILSSAILDRLVHYSAVIKINGASYRAKNIKDNKKTEEKMIIN